MCNFGFVVVSPRSKREKNGTHVSNFRPPPTNSLGLVTSPPSEVTISEEDCSCNRKLIRLPWIDEFTKLKYIYLCVYILVYMYKYKYNYVNICSEESKT